MTVKELLEVPFGKAVGMGMEAALKLPFVAALSLIAMLLTAERFVGVVVRWRKYSW